MTDTVTSFTFDTLTAIGSTLPYPWTLVSGDLTGELTLDVSKTNRETNVIPTKYCDDIPAITGYKFRVKGYYE